VVLGPSADDGGAMSKQASNKTPRSQEIQILQEALEYWGTDGTDEEAQESGCDTAEDMAQQCREDLFEMGVERAQDPWKGCCRHFYEVPGHEGLDTECEACRNDDDDRVYDPNAESYR
jgi:hypothetical protein